MVAIVDSVLAQVTVNQFAKPSSTGPDKRSKKRSNVKPYGSKTSKKANYCDCCTSFARQEKKHIKRRERQRVKNEIGGLQLQESTDNKKKKT